MNIKQLDDIIYKICFTKRKSLEMEMFHVSQFSL